MDKIKSCGHRAWTYVRVVEINSQGVRLEWCKTCHLNRRKVVYDLNRRAYPKAYTYSKPEELV
jgi:hypothetical protein